MMIFGKKKELDNTPVVAPQNVKLCKGCGRLMQLDQLVCANCGHREKFCKNCGKTIPEKEIHCMYCRKLC